MVRLAAPGVRGEQAADPGALGRDALTADQDLSSPCVQEDTMDAELGALAVSGATTLVSPWSLIPGSAPVR